MVSDEEILVMAEEAFKKSGLEESCKEGYLVGYFEGFKQGYREGQLRVAKRMIDMGFSCEKVAHLVEMPQAEIEKL